MVCWKFFTLTLLLVIIGLSEGKKKKKQGSETQECAGPDECEKITGDAFLVVCRKPENQNLNKCAVVVLKSKDYNGEADPPVTEPMDLTMADVKCTKITDKNTKCYKECKRLENRVFVLEGFNVPACLKKADAYACPVKSDGKSTCTCSVFADEDAMKGKKKPDGSDFKTADECPS